VPDPIQFTSTTPRFALPLLFAGQAQKEFFVNEAHALLDALLHPAVEGENSVPPIAPVEGEAWLVATPAQGEWLGREGSLATYVGARWLFASPQSGMRLFRKDLGQLAIYNDSWMIASEPSVPSGGTTIDGEARAAISELITTLRTAGFLPLA